jgi:hypothetical protein
MGKRRQSGARLALLGLGLLLIGCGAPRRIDERPLEVYATTGATLEGMVHYGADKVVAGLVIAQNDNGVATGFVDEHGHYKMNNVPLGEVSIAVNTEAGKGQARGRLMVQPVGAPGHTHEVIDVPSAFADPATSGIKTTIDQGPNRFDIVIPR